ncbi:MAG: LPS export ABC transporter periplasmic protein LptC [Halanaerobiales bacterium]|nr:LPS export ABC transporter periplasmic protein LptC [Halanaerobiales bacterium]
MYFKDKKKILFAAIVILIIIGGVAFSIYHEMSREDNIQQGNNNGSPENEYLTNIDLELYNNDKTIKWNLDSEKLVREDEGNIYKMDLPNFQAYENDQLLYTGQGNSASYNNNEEMISLTGNIEIDKNKLLLETDKITWNQKNDEIRGENGVKLTSPELIITSKEFTAPVSLNRIVFKGSENKRAKVEWR